MAGPTPPVELTLAANAPIPAPGEPLAAAANTTRKRVPIEEVPLDTPVPVPPPTPMPAPPEPVAAAAAAAADATRKHAPIDRAHPDDQAPVPAYDGHAGGEAGPADSRRGEALYLRAGRYTYHHTPIILSALAAVVLLAVLGIRGLSASSNSAVALRPTTTAAGTGAHQSGTAGTLSETASTPQTSTPPTSVRSTSPPASQQSTNQGGGGVLSTTTATPAPLSRCHTSDLQARLGQQTGGAGHVFLPVILKNTASRTCTMTGYPGVSLLDSSNNQIGAPADKSGGTISTVQLSPGTEASTVLETTNMGFGPPCVGPSTNIRIYPPDEVASLVIPGSFIACGGFTVQPLVAGTP